MIFGMSAQEFAQALFEEAGDALILFDPETEQILEVNPMAQRLSGFSRRALREIHDRMPVIVPRVAYGTWLDPTRRGPSLNPLLPPYVLETFLTLAVPPPVTTWRPKAVVCLPPSPLACPSGCRLPTPRWPLQMEWPINSTLGRAGSRSGAG